MDLYKMAAWENSFVNYKKHPEKNQKTVLAHGCLHLYAWVHAHCLLAAPEQRVFVSTEQRVFVGTEQWAFLLL